jgi:uncharacterized protein (TIGR02266 family)
MKIKIKYVKDSAVLYVDGNIDINSVELIEKIMALGRNGYKKILLNFKKVNLVDYSGLSMLAIAHKNARNIKVDVRLCDIPLPVLELLRLVHLDGVLDIYLDEESAIRSFSEEHFEIEKRKLRRRFDRIEVNLHVRYRPRNRTKTSGFTQKVMNISGAGLYIHTNHVYPIGTKVEMEFNIPNRKDALISRGEVIWIADKELQNPVYPGMGIRFTDMDSFDYRELLSFIQRHEVGGGHKD